MSDIFCLTNHAGRYIFTSMKRKRISIRLEVLLYKKLAAEAKRKETRLSDVVRELLLVNTKHHNGEPL